MENNVVNDLAEQFLRRCLRTRIQTTSLENLRDFTARAHLKWDIVEQRIRQELLGPLIFSVVGDQEIVPAALERRLQQEFITRATGSTYQLHQMWKIVEKLQSVAIEAILLKGAALSLTVYSQDSPRFFGDVDLVVREKDVNKTLQVCKDLGFESVEKLQPDAQDLVPYKNEWQFTKAGHLDVEVDLHWHLFSWVYYQNSVPMDWFWQTTMEVEVDKKSALILGPEAQLIHLCVHLMQHHRVEWAGSLRLLHDIAEVINEYQDQVNWHLLLSKVEDFKLVMPVQQVLLHVWQNWQVPIPEKIVEQLRAMLPSPAEERAFNYLIKLEGGADPQFALQSLRSLPDWQSKLRYVLRNLLFPSASYMRQRYNIKQGFLLPFYYPYRWLQGLRNALLSDV